MNRNKKGCESAAGPVKEKQEVSGSLQSSNSAGSSTSTTSTLEEAEKNVEETDKIIVWLQTACCKSQLKEIHQKTRETFAIRSAMRENDSDNILLRFPRFLDTPGLVSTQIARLSAW